MKKIKIVAEINMPFDIKNYLYQQIGKTTLSNMFRAYDLIPVFDDEIIEFENKKISMAVYDQLRKRERSSPQIISLYRHILLSQHEKIVNSDGILLLNYLDDVMNPNVQFQSSIAWALKKPIFIWNNIDKYHVWYEVFQAMNVILIDRSVSLIAKEFTKIPEKEVEIKKGIKKFQLKVK